MATITSNFGGRFLNELKVYGSTDRRTGRPLLVLPAGRVQVSSELDGGDMGIATLTFGGNTGLPQDGETKALEATNEVSWLTDDGRTASSSARYSTSRSSAKTSRRIAGEPSRSTRWRTSRPAAPRRSRVRSLRACARGRARMCRCIWPTRGAFRGRYS